MERAVECQGWTLGPHAPGFPTGANGRIYETTSLGWGNYNGAFLSFTFRDCHGLTARSNLTFSKTLGTVGLHPIHQFHHRA